jgi:hypothetical protein
MATVILGLTVMGTALGSTGCATYVTPNDAADFRVLGVVSEQERDDLTPLDIQALMARKPLAKFPASIAVVRVQAPKYRNYTTESYGKGRYSVVTTRDIETEEDFAALAQLPMVRGVGMVNRLVLPERLETDNELRQAAARLQADMLLFYTVDTAFYIGDTSSPIEVITLGFLPSKQARVTSTASAAIIDTRSGYIYGLAEASATHRQLANTWTTRAAADASRRRAESEAFSKLVSELQSVWQGIVATYAAPPATAPQAAVH